jgi:hypothetical protein
MIGTCRDNCYHYYCFQFRHRDCSSTKLFNGLLTRLPNSILRFCDAQFNGKDFSSVYPPCQLESPATISGTTQGA